MPKILSPERVIEYTVEFKVKVVDPTYTLDANAIRIATALGLHPMMVYRWRQEYREGKFVGKSTRRISMTAEPSDPTLKRRACAINPLCCVVHL